MLGQTIKVLKAMEMCYFTNKIYLLPGTHGKEPTTSLCFWNDVFTDGVIFRLIFPGNQTFPANIQKFGFINGVDNVNWPPYRDSKS